MKRINCYFAMDPLDDEEWRGETEVKEIVAHVYKITLCIS